jgi:hypothetical protein
MHERRSSVLIAGLLLAAMSGPASAQRVEGLVRDAGRGVPVAGARLLLVNDASEAIDSTVADRAGRYRLSAPSAGSYAIHFQLDGWAGMLSERFSLEAGRTLPFDFDIELVAHSALVQMRDIIGSDARLQSALPELCGEPFRAWEAGLLVGVVRSRATRQPIAGARVSLAAARGGLERHTISSENGVYVLCNVQVGPAVQITVEAPDGIREMTDVEIRAGTASWYDLPVGPRRR